jgi:hypothetical protein
VLGVAEEVPDLPPDDVVIQSISAPPQPAPVPVRVNRPPSPTAPLPITYKIENGQRACEKKHDKPQKSDKNKSGHMDMECCLDPDEVPNPHCYYPEEKYGKYLKKSH